MAEALLRLMPPMVIADLGAGEGAFALLLAERAKKVIAVDTSAKMIEVGREQALRHGVKNVEFRLGDMEELPIATRSRSGLLLAVAPSRPAPRARHPARPGEFSPGGRIVILDLLKHRFEEARELYADEWLGFSEAELEAMLEEAGFTTLLACKPRSSTKSQETPRRSSGTCGAATFGFFGRVSVSPPTTRSAASTIAASDGSRFSVAAGNSSRRLASASALCRRATASKARAPSLPRSPSQKACVRSTSRSARPCRPCGKARGRHAQLRAVIAAARRTKSGVVDGVGHGLSLLERARSEPARSAR
jgi:hypothetical protein